MSREQVSMGEKGKVGVVGRVLRRAGYVSAARAQELTAALARAEGQIADLRRALEAAKKEAHDLKEKVRERSERAQQERAELEARHQARFAKLEQKAEHEAKRARDRDARTHDLHERVQEARQRMAWAEKATTLGREHLMAIEVKLDIVEGAIKVLDQRTRAALAAARDGRDAGRGTGRLT